MKRNDWQARFGAKRRAIDRKILAECEREISKAPTPREAAIAAAERIAKAFGRPIH